MIKVQNTKKGFCLIPILVGAVFLSLGLSIGTVVQQKQVVKHYNNGICYNPDTGRTFKCRLKETYNK